MVNILSTFKRIQKDWLGVHGKRELYNQFEKLTFLTLAGVLCETRVC